VANKKFQGYPWRTNEGVSSFRPARTGWSPWKSSFFILGKSSTLKKSLTSNESQKSYRIVQDLPFVHKISKMNNCTFVLHGRILCRSFDYFDQTSHYIVQDLSFLHKISKMNNCIAFLSYMEGFYVIHLTTLIKQVTLYCARSLLFAQNFKDKQLHFYLIWKVFLSPI